MADTRHLEKRREGWAVVVYVPERLHHVMPKKLRKGLGTRDLKVAQARRWQVIADFQARIAEAERGMGMDPLLTEAFTWRDAIREARAQDTRRGGDGGPEEPPGDEEIQAPFLAQRYEAIRRERGSPAAVTFWEIASGTGTPLLHFLPAWLEEGGVKGTYRTKTKGQLEGNIRRLADWVEAQKLAPTLEAIDRRRAGAFVTELSKGLDRRTVARIVSACRSFWVYLGRKGHAPDDRNPWDKQAPPRAKNSGQEVHEERPFTKEEMVALLRGPAGAEMGDLLRVSALSGMRIDEVYRLTVADCREGMFRVRRAKTNAGRREVPIHPDLSTIVARRVCGKEPDAFLFHEAGIVVSDTREPVAPPNGRRKAGEVRVVREGQERSAAASKRFARYRKAVGVADNVPGKRRSLVNFHSARRWFVTEALRNGNPERVVQQVIGHKLQGVTFRYFGSDEAATLRACVESVRLPALDDDTASLSHAGP